MPRTTLIALEDYFKELIAEEIASDHCNSASKFMRENLRLFDERRNERNAMMETLRSMLVRSEQSGGAEPFDLDRIKAKVRQTAAECKPGSNR